MSKVLKTIGAIASIAALIPGPHQPFAAGIAAAANIGAKVTAKKPPARGSITESVIDVDPPRPYLMGETYFAGVLRFRAAYGPTLKKVPNPYMWQVFVHSGVGPVDALVQQQFDYGAIGSYYSGFYASDTQLGDVPEATALVPPYGAAPGWGASSKLSGCAAIGSNYKFDKDGKVFANGIPPQGAIWRGVKVYDPRLDSTFPGGSGSHRLGNESTYTYSANPALHAGMYAYGRYVSGERVFGMGMPADGIDWQAVAAWANDCDLNEWEISGVIFEGGSQSGPEIKASNLDNICLAGGGRWLTNGAVLTFDWHRPRVPLATITDFDLVEGGIQAVAAQSFRERINTVRPQYTSPAHNWQLITAEPIVGSTYLSEDEVTRSQSWPFNLVKDATQAGQLASYEMADSREIGPITFNAGIDWRFYRPGDTLTLDSDLIGYNGQVVIERRIAEPETARVVFQFKTETPGKHDFALGKVADPPPTPTLGQTAEERDALAAAVNESIVAQANIRGAAIKNPRNFADAPISLLKATALPANINITVARHDWDYPDADTVTRELDALVNTLDDGVTPIPEETTVYVYFDDTSLTDTTPEYKVTTSDSVALNSAANPGRHSVGAIVTPPYGLSGEIEQNRNVGYGFYIP